MFLRTSSGNAKKDQYEHELNQNFKSLLRRLINCDEIRLRNTFGSKLDEMPAD